MKRFFILSALYLIILSVVTGCAGGDGIPIVPDADQNYHPELTTEFENTAQAESQTRLWGYFDLIFDLESKNVEIIPNRSVEFTVNIVKFLNNDPLGLAISFNGTSAGPGYIDVDMDIAISHPMSDQKFVGYDVRGIFIGNGSGVIDYNNDLHYAVQGSEQILLNADGYSRWFNPVEFGSDGIFGSPPGNFAPPDYTGTATLNPYKYFAHGLGPSDDLWPYISYGAAAVGYFMIDTTNTRNYVIRFPVPIPGIKYGYAVTANWEGGAPEFHPSHAPEALAVKVVDNSTLYYVDPTDYGGDLILDISVFDWDAELDGGVMEDYHIKIESTVLSAHYDLNVSQMTPTGSGTHWYTYHVEIPSYIMTSTEGNEMWVIVEDEHADYTNPFGVPNDADTDPLAACFRFDLDVASEPQSWIHVIDPNGGEEWKVGSAEDITWDSYGDIENVRISRSFDSGGNYTWVISESTENDGIFTWDPIPSEVVGEHNRIMVSDVADINVSDESDSDFTIGQPTITILSPNGGEEWNAGDSKIITWGSSGDIDLVKISCSINSGVNYTYVISESTENDGNFTWDPIPLEMVGENNRIMVSDVTDINVSDESDADFTIALPTITLLSPNGGEEFVQGTDEEITWTSENVTGKVFIEYSKDNFVSDINSIATDVVNDGSYLWEDIPADQSNTLRVKVGLSVFPEINDVTDGVFSILGSGWARTWGNVEYDCVVAVVADTDGSVYATGRRFSSPDNSFVFLRKYDLNGQQLWKKTWGSIGDCCGTGLVIDGDGDIYITGYFEWVNVDFDPGTGTDIHSSVGGSDVFLSKFDSSGTFMWAQTWGGSSDDYGKGVTICTSKVYVTGRFQGTDVDFDPGAGIDLHSSNGSYDAFLNKFDLSGSHSWAGTWGGSDYDSGQSVASPSYGWVVVTGWFIGLEVDFDPDPIDIYPRSSNGQMDVFVCWFADNNDFCAAAAWGGSGNDQGLSIDIESPLDVLISGYFEGTDVDFDPGIGTDLHSSVLNCDIFLSKFDENLIFQWARTWGGKGIDVGYGVTTDDQGYTFVAGGFQDDVDFDPGTGADVRSASGAMDAYWSKFDSSGNYLTARTWGGTSGNVALSLFVPNSTNMIVAGNLFVGGNFTETGVEFAPVDPPCSNDSDTHDSSGSNDAFLIRYMEDGCW